MFLFPLWPAEVFLVFTRKVLKKEEKKSHLISNSAIKADAVFTPQVPVHVFLDFSTLECKHLSESVELFVLDLMDAPANYTNREVKVRFTQWGHATW